MTNQQKFLLDNRQLGKLVKVEIYGATRTQKKQKVIKKHYLITVYNRVMVDEQVFSETGDVTVVSKEKFVKWGDFTFSEVMHPKDRIIEMLSKIERPLNYIPDIELSEELIKRDLMHIEKFPDEELIKEMKRRGITEFANSFKISKNATKFQKLVSFLKERKKIPDTKMSFEETVAEIKKRHLLLPEDFMTDDELLKELARRDIRNTLPVLGEPLAQPTVSDDLFEELPKSPDEIDPEDLASLIR